MTRSKLPNLKQTQGVLHVDYRYTELIEVVYFRSQAMVFIYSVEEIRRGYTMASGVSLNPLALITCT